jgi:hypothetical protein
MKKILTLFVAIMFALTSYAQSFQLSSGYLFNIQTYSFDNLNSNNNPRLHGAYFTLSPKVLELSKMNLFMDVSVGFSRSAISKDIVDMELDFLFATFPISLEEVKQCQHRYFSVSLRLRSSAIKKRFFINFSGLVGFDQTQIQSVSVGQFFLQNYGVYGEEILHQQNRLFGGTGISFEYVILKNINLQFGAAYFLSPIEIDRVTQFKNNTGNDLAINALFRIQYFAGLTYNL